MFWQGRKTLCWLLTSSTPISRTLFAISFWRLRRAVRSTTRRSWDFDRLLDDPNLLAQNLNRYIGCFSENVKEVIDRFGFADQIARMDERNLLYEVIKAFAGVEPVVGAG